MEDHMDMEFLSSFGFGVDVGLCALLLLLGDLF
jgi:hypothetical protein